MSTQDLFLHLIRITIEKQVHLSAWPIIRRKYMIETLSDEGLDKLHLLSDEELHQIWIDTFIDRKTMEVRLEFNAQPDPYSLMPCYTFLLDGLGKYQAPRYEITSDGVAALQLNNKVSYFVKLKPSEIQWAMNTFWVIGVSDPVIQTWLSRLEKEKSRFLMDFALSEDQLIEFSSLYRDYFR